MLLRLLLKRPGLYIFNYHNFSTFRNHIWKFGSLFECSSENSFERQLLFFKKHLNSLDDFGISRNLDNNNFYIVTFDDGYKDNYQIALPLLERYHVPAILFITTGVIGTKKMLWHDRIGYHYENHNRGGIWKQSRLKKGFRKELLELKSLSHAERIHRVAVYPDHGKHRLMMNWDEVKKARRKGALIGCHTHTHPILSKMSKQAQADEIDQSFKAFDTYLDERPIFFAYPDGKEDTFDKTTIRVLREKGFSFAMTTVFGINRKQRGPFQLRRIGINPSDSIPVLALKLIMLLLHTELCHLMEKLKNHYRQYGFIILIKRLIKKAFSPIFHMETYILCRVTLPNDKNIPQPKIAVEVGLMRLEEVDNLSITEDKKKLFTLRLKDENNACLVARHQGEIVYFSWVCLNKMEVIPHYITKLKPLEGYLFDAHCFEKWRGNKLHGFMSQKRLHFLQEAGKKIAFVSYLQDNKVAAQIHTALGFRPIKLIRELAFAKKITIALDKNLT